MSTKIALEASSTITLPSNVKAQVWHPLPEKEVYFPFVNRPGVPVAPAALNITPPRPELRKAPIAGDAMASSVSVPSTEPIPWVAGSAAVGIVVLLVGLWAWGRRAQ